MDGALRPLTLSTSAPTLQHQHVHPMACVTHGTGTHGTGTAALRGPTGSHTGEIRVAINAVIVLTTDNLHRWHSLGAIPAGTARQSRCPRCCCRTGTCTQDTAGARAVPTLPVWFCPAGFRGFGFQTRRKPGVSGVFAAPAELAGERRARAGGAGAVEPVWPGVSAGQTGGMQQPELSNCSRLPPLEFPVHTGQERRDRGLDKLN